MSNDGGNIQGMDTIPKQIGRLYAEELALWLPGWSKDGEYNYRPGASTQPVAAQLDLVMHKGSHPWINTQLATLIKQLDADDTLSDAQKTVRAAALVNFMNEASLGDGAKTNGFIAYANRDDPKLRTLKRPGFSGGSYL